MFVDKKTGEPLRDPQVNARIVAAIEAEGADAWFTRDPADFLGDGRDPAAYEQVQDILDVWFDSGSTHAFTIEGRTDSHWPADLYLEGSDQHRGWFQSSLLEACGTRGRAPFEAVLTHGFTLTEQGEKMSKSLGNAVEPLTVTEQSGAEILRLWVAMVDYAEDQRIGKTILQTTTDAYRKLRNTVRYLLGALEGFDAAERVERQDMPPLEQFVLHRLWELDGRVRAAYERYDFKDVWREVGEFASNDLSALYFDIRKDALYCDAPSSQAPARLPHGDGPSVRAADGVAVAPLPLHHGGGLDHPLPRLRLQLPAGDPRDSAGMAQRGRGGAVGVGLASAGCGNGSARSGTS